MKITNANGIYTVKTDVYEIALSDEKIDLTVAGEVLAGLRPVSAVNTCGEGEATNQDSENEGTRLTRADDTTFVWESSSSLWDKKEYIIRCFEDRFEYSIRLTGKGNVDTVNYFSGKIDAAFAGSTYEFDTGFSPIVSGSSTDPGRFFASASKEELSYLTVPPLFVYSFSTAGIAEKTVFALAADRGNHNFIQFNYKVNTGEYWSRFWFWTDQSGHTKVDGTWETPRILCYTTDTDMDALRYYSDYYFREGIAKPKDPAEVKPRWWHGPIACGWVEQFAYNYNYNAGIGQSGLACEKVYNNFIRELREKDLHPTLMIIDDMWQKEYGNCMPDTEKWPDLRGFIDRNLEENGIYTMLWFRLWAHHGLPEEMGVYDEQYNTLLADPTSPAYREKLRELLYHLLSSDEGCCNAYGLKLDYAFMQPTGRKANSYGGKYGVELLLEMIALIHDIVKEVKPEAIINASPCHPLFAEYVDHLRLHDYTPACRRCTEEFQFRKSVWEISAPGALIDTDGAGFAGYRDTMRYMRLAPTLGIPDLYAISPMPGAKLSDEDWAVVADVWKKYSEKIDKLYE